MNENFAVFCLMLSLCIVASCAYGFVFGFPVFLAVVAGLSLVTLLWCRFVVCRPRVARRGAFVGEFFGDRYYLLEGVA